MSTPNSGAWRAVTTNREGALRQHVLHHISGEVRAYALLKGLDLDVERRLGVGLGRVVKFLEVLLVLLPLLVDRRVLLFGEGGGDGRGGEGREQGEGS